jgi:hypothetical protein
MREQRFYSLLLAASLAAIVLVGLLLAPAQRALAWLLTALLMAFCVTVAGRQATRSALAGGHTANPGVWRGALIDERNKISLSRLQMLAWTIVVLSAYLTAVLQRVAVGETDALAVAIPQQLWWLMGISTASLVGSRLITGQKMAAEPRTLEGQTKKGAPENLGHVVGVVTTNETPYAASWANIFQEEEVLGKGSLDLSKIQMFFFTVVILVAYCANLWSSLSHAPGVLQSLPPVADSMNVLLGISHAGYLTTKATPVS